MKIKTKKYAIALCCSLMALGVVSGAAAIGSSVANAEEAAASVPSVAMLGGARVKMNVTETKLKFEAAVENYNAEDTAVKYGMLIMPEATYAAKTFNGDYHAVLEADTYQDVACTPYAVGKETQISASIAVAEEDYATSYIAIAYTEKEGTYTYADVNVYQHARSVAYVSQMALNYDEELTEAQTDTLETLAVDATYDAIAAFDKDADIVESGITLNGAATTTETSYAASVCFDGFETNKTYPKTFVSKAAYQNLTEITFDAYVPADSYMAWWGIAPISALDVDCYTGAGQTTLCNKVNARDTWISFKYVIKNLTWSLSYKLPGDETYTDTGASYTCDNTQGEYRNDDDNSSYIYILGEMGEKGWGNILLDNFVVKANGQTYTDDFESGESTLFDLTAKEDSVPASVKALSKKAVQIGAADEGYTAILDFQRYQTNKNYGKSFISKVSYKNITEVSFEAYYPSTAPSVWWGLTFVGDAAASSCYAGGGTTANLGSLTKDTWMTVKYTSEDGLKWTASAAVKGSTEYTKICEATLDASVAQNANGASFLYFLGNMGQANFQVKIDNVTIVADGVKYMDGFEGGVSSLFVANAREASAGSIIPVTYAKPDFTATLDFERYQTNKAYGKSFISNLAYKNITEVTFDAYIPETSLNDQWWGVGFVADASKSSCYACGGTTANLSQIKSDKGVWYTYKYSSADGLTWDMTKTVRGADTWVKACNSATLTAADAQDANGASYIYFVGNMGKAGFTVEIDNVTIKADGKTYTDGFEDGKSALFIANKREESAGSIVPVTFAAPDATPIPTFADRLADGSIVDYLLNGVTGFSGSVTLDKTRLSDSALLMEGTVAYSITGKKGVALILGRSETSVEYLYITENAIALYNGTTLVKEIALESAENELCISLLANGRLLVKINDAEYVGMGTIAAPCAIYAVDVEGSGSIDFTTVNVNAYGVAA